MTDFRLTATEAERLAYISGDMDRAALLARIADMQRALGQAVAALEEIAYTLPEQHRPGAAREALAIVQNLSIPGVLPL